MRRERDRRLRGSVSLSLEKVRWAGGTKLCLKGGSLGWLVQWLVGNHQILKGICGTFNRFD